MLNYKVNKINECLYVYEPPERRPFGRAEEAFQLRGRHAGGPILSELREQKTIPEP